MVTIAHLVKKIVQDNHFLVEAMSKELISYGNLAEQIQPKIEEELGKKVKLSAITMALRRFADELESFSQDITSFDFKGEILMRTNIISLNVVKSPKLLGKLKDVYSIVDFEKGDVLNVIVGNNEASIVSNQKYEKELSQFLKGEKLIHKESDLVALTLIFDSDDFITTPGGIFMAVRKIAWEGINIYEIISTLRELTFIISKKDSMKGYSLLQDLVR